MREMHSKSENNSGDGKRRGIKRKRKTSESISCSLGVKKISVEEKGQFDQKDDLELFEECLTLSESPSVESLDASPCVAAYADCYASSDCSTPESQASESSEDGGTGKFVVASTKDKKLDYDSSLMLCRRYRSLPWPSLLTKVDWGNVRVWWNHYITKDSETLKLRDPEVFNHHPGLMPRMRSVLLEWLIEVCDVFKLHRETFHLTVDYLDRYLCSSKNIPKAKLQLIGISCLLIASKVEEIYPPKVSEYAFVTDGACSEQDILKTELNIIKALKWKFKSVTANSWMLIYLQLGYIYVRKDSSYNCLQPSYPPDLYKTASVLLDLATLDIRSLTFNYSVLAISALYVVCNGKYPLKVSGYKLCEISECVHWLEAFWSAICENKNIDCNIRNQLPPPPKRPVIDMTHFLQQFVVSLDLLESAQANVEANNLSSNLLTPPPSSEKMSCTGNSSSSHL